MQESFREAPAAAPLSLLPLLTNPGTGRLLARILPGHIERFGSTLANREAFAPVFPSRVVQNRPASA